MPLAQNFSIIENDPDWQNLTLPEQNRIRREWIIRKQAASGKPKDPAFRQQLETEAFATAPEWARPYQPTSWRERHPELYAAGATAIGTPLRLLETPQQLIANLIAPIIRGERYEPTPRGAIRAVTTPFERTGRFMVGEEEPTELPGGEITRILTDPLMYTGVGELAATRAAARAAPKGVRMLPPLTRKAGERLAKKGLSATIREGEVAAPGLAEWVEEIPRSWATWSPANRQVYTQIMGMGRRHIPRDQLQRVAETIVNAGPEQGREAIRVLREGQPTKIRSLVAWTGRAPWERRVVRGTKKVTPTTPPPAGGAAPPTGEAASVAEQASQPGGWADYIEQMMKPPTL